MSKGAGIGAPERRPGKVRGELRALGQRPRKRFGQHFLADPGIAARIVALAQLTGNEAVVEVGPGLGALTDALVQSSRQIWLIEIDTGLAANLRQRYAAAGHVHVIEADVLDLDFAEVLPPGEVATVVANLPYNIATPLIAELVQQGQRFRRLVLMVQREVAQRLRAKPGSKDYSALSVCVQFAAAVQRGFVVGPGAFVPRPKVDSEVIVLEPHAEPPVAVTSNAAFRHLVRTVFHQRRKQLINSLKLVSEEPQELLQRAGIDPKRRPETLSLQEFATLSNLLNHTLETPALVDGVQAPLSRATTGAGEG